MANASLEHDPQQAAQAHTPPDEPAPLPQLLAAVHTLSESDSLPHERATELLHILIEGLGGVAGAITVAIDRDEFEHASQGGPAGIEGWHAHIKDAALDARSHGRTVGRVFGADPQQPDVVLVAAPLQLGGGDPFGGIAILCPWPGRQVAERLQLHLHAAALVGSQALGPRATAAPSLRIDDFARVLARAGRYRSIHEFAFAITNAVKQRYGCEQVSLGLLNGDALKVVCISGLEQVNERSPGVHHIEQSMCECLDACAVITEQDRDQWASETTNRGGLLHARWRAAAGGVSIVSIPLFAGDRPAGVLSMTRVATDPFKPEELESLQKLLTPLAAAIPLVHKSTRSLKSHTRASIEDTARWIARPRSNSKRIAVGAAVLLVLWFTFKPTMYRVTAQATVVAAAEVIVASTLDTAVSDVLVRSGDRVAAGQPLIRLDTSTLEVQRVHLQTEVERADLRLKSAITQDDPAAAAIARAERGIHQAELELTDSKIDRAVLVAPVAGLVIGSELSNLQGRLVPVGEPLLSIASEESLALEIGVPERRVTDLAEGASIRFASHARPEDAERLSLVHIEPAATVRDGKPVFVAHGELTEGQSWLRPGMEGIAKIDVGRRPNWWVGSHHLIDYARLRFWIH